MADPDLQIRGEGWGGDGLQNTFFRPFGPHFGRKIRGDPGPPDPFPGSATARFKQESMYGLSTKKLAVVERWPLWRGDRYWRLDCTFFRRCLNVPVTGHSFEDTLLMAAATTHGLPPETGVIEFKKTATKLG